ISDGATRRPISALTSVDLPDLIRPATATCNGLCSLRNTSANPAAVRLLTCGCNCLHRLATEADSGPWPPEYSTVVVTGLPPVPCRKSCHAPQGGCPILPGSQSLYAPWWTRPHAAAQYGDRVRKLSLWMRAHPMVGDGGIALLLVLLDGL